MAVNLETAALFANLIFNVGNLCLVMHAAKFIVKKIFPDIQNLFVID